MGGGEATWELSVLATRCFYKPKTVLRSKRYFFFNIYLFILAAPGPHCHGVFSCGMRTLSCGMHEGSSSPTRD